MDRRLVRAVQLLEEASLLIDAVGTDERDSTESNDELVDATEAWCSGLDDMMEEINAFETK